MAWLTADLLTSVRLRCRVPTLNAVMSPAEILRLADEEMLTKVVPIVRKVKANYWVRQSDTTIVASQTDYRIPSRAQAGTFQDVTYVSGGNEYPMHQVSLDSYPLASISSTSEGRHRHYALQGDLVKLITSPSSGQASDSLRFRFHQRPSSLVDSDTTTQGTTLASITASDKFTGTNVPSGWTTATKLDVVQATPGFDSLAFDSTATSVGTGVGGLIVGFDTTEMAVGDWVMEAGVSAVPQCPDICHPLLAAATSVRVLDALGDIEGADAVRKDLATIVQTILDTIEERDEGDTPKIRTKSSLLRSGLRWGRR